MLARGGFNQAVASEVLRMPLEDAEAMVTRLRQT